MSTAPLVETTEDRLRRELAESAARQRAEEASEARENKLREDVARLRADNSALTALPSNGPSRCIISDTSST